MKEYRYQLTINGKDFVREGNLYYKNIALDLKTELSNLTYSFSPVAAYVAFNIFKGVYNKTTGKLSGTVITNYNSSVDYVNFTITGIEGIN